MDPALLNQSHSLLYKLNANEIMTHIMPIKVIRHLLEKHFLILSISSPNDIFIGILNGILKHCKFKVCYLNLGSIIKTKSESKAFPICFNPFLQFAVSQFTRFLRIAAAKIVVALP